MIKANINKEKPPIVIVAAGNALELMNDAALLINGIYTQLKNGDPKVAQLFRTGMIRMVSDEGGPVWAPGEGQTGIVFMDPKED